MRTILLTIIVFFIANQLFAQDFMDPAKIFSRDTSSAINQSNNEFIRSWNWGTSGAALDAAMRMHWYHSMDLHPDSTNYHGNCRLLYPLTHPDPLFIIIGGHYDYRLFQAHSLYLDPTIIVDSTQNFKPKPYDNTGAVFGFLYKSKVILLDSSLHDSSNYSRAILSKDSLTTGQSEVVLKNIWKAKLFTPPFIIYVKMI